jgi:proton-translocating NADH-quinone oxidoreductase chain N
VGLLDFLTLPDMQWQGLMPEIVILLFALLSPLLSVWEGDRRSMRVFALYGLGGALFMALGSLLDLHFTIPFTNIVFTLQYQGTNLGGAFVVSYASQLFKVIFLGVAFLAVLGIGRPLKGKTEEDWGEFYSLLMFAVLGMMVVASAQELFTLVIGIEMASICSYLLAGFRRDAVGGEASLKYFTIGAISSGLLLFAVSLIYGMAGTTSIPALAHVVAHGPFDSVSLVVIVMLLAGLGFKISSVPFHAWAPDVYSGAPAPVAGMLAAGSKAMGFVAVFNVFLVGLVGLKSNWELTVAIIAAASMTFGNIVALQQTNIRRMLAYSSIAQAGYVLIAVAVGGSAQDGGVWAVGGGIFHLMTNAAMKLGAFLIVGGLLTAGVPDDINSWRGLGRRAPFFSLAMTLFLLSMAGLPPLAGFASKFVLFSGAVDAGVTANLGWMVWLAVFGVANSAVSLFYYFRLIRAMYVEDGEEGHLDMPTGTGAAVVACVALTLAMGLWPQPFLQAAFKAAASLLGLG